MNNQHPFMFIPEDKFNVINDIKNLYSQINLLQQQLNSLEKRINIIEKKNTYPPSKPSPIPINSNTNYPTDNYII